MAEPDLPLGPTAQPSLFLLAGPNGAGKSTLYTDRIEPMTRAPFINADEILKRWRADGHCEVDAYAASREAAAQRERFIQARRSFVSESVFSHPSKIELVETAVAAGYRVVLYHVNVRLPEMSVARVAARVATGGHRVAEDKIRERYDRNQALIRRAADIATMTHVFDNSKRGQPPQWVLTLEQGIVAARADMTCPDWVETLYLR
ncbi:zeta toxin family protein [Salinisphaera sp. SPP-AMP-43]|uniref:zeta toxin family protein n=1 Tax=Salinisphaera sp. SPP-AMP-43 TaxID=3121288 RepID=UPI003C6E29E1